MVVGIIILLLILRNVILFVKLNSKSKYIFRLDVLGFEIENLNKILNVLKQNSIDPVFFGYPYGLIEADKFARIQNSELEILKTKFRIYAKNKWKNIESLIKTKNSHSILDNIL
jgi:hypothetical protein